MKKIVALVLSLVMVLGLATTAFAAPDKYDMYKANDTLNAMLALGTPAAAGGFGGVEITDHPAKSYTDGSGNVAYVEINGGYYVKNTTPTINSFAITAAGKSTILYYLDFIGVEEGVFYYKASVTEFTDFGYKCGQVTIDPVADAEKTFFKTVAGVVYEAKADTEAVQDNNYLLDGEVVTAAAVPETVIAHSFLLNDYKYDSVKKVNVPTAAVCTTCLMETSNVFKASKVPATYTVQTTTGTGYPTYVVALDLNAPAASAPVVDTDKVESAETFDAGIAMYVGMSVMAAAGSAVVLKKKD